MRKALGYALIGIPVLGYFVGAFISLGPEKFLQLIGVFGLVGVAAGMVIGGIKLLGK